MNMFTEIYSFEKEHGGLTEMNLNGELSKGKEFFRNDWFMGPFYSYDANERQMKRKNGENQVNGDVASDWEWWDVMDGQLFGVDNILSTFFYKVNISFDVL